MFATLGQRPHLREPTLYSWYLLRTRKSVRRSPPHESLHIRKVLSENELLQRGRKRLRQRETRDGQPNRSARQSFARRAEHYLRFAVHLCRHDTRRGHSMHKVLKYVQQDCCLHISLFCNFTRHEDNGVCWSEGQVLRFRGHQYRVLRRGDALNRREKCVGLSRQGTGDHTPALI